MKEYPDEDRVWFICPVCQSRSNYLVYESFQDGFDFTIEDAPEENIKEMIEGSERGEFQCFACRTFLWLSVVRDERKVIPYNKRKNKYR